MQIKAVSPSEGLPVGFATKPIEKGLTMKKRTGKDLLSLLRAAGLTEYGATFSGDQVRGWLGIEMPHVASKRTFDALALQELSAIDYCRNQLLDEGKYLRTDGTGYRILLPSENMVQIEAYHKAASRKLKRAQKLVRTTPPTDGHHEPADNVLARLLLKQDHMKRSKLGKV
jgi:hypothetical protein